MLESRKVRNALEHFDDRLDRYFEAGHRMVVDRNSGPKRGRGPHVRGVLTSKQRMR